MISVMIPVKEGMRVKRGPSWEYGNQDGGEGQEGTVLANDYDEWWRVQWDRGYSDVYRVSEQFQDIIPVDEEAFRKKKEAESECTCGGPEKTIEIMNMAVAICTACNKRK